MTETPAPADAFQLLRMCYADGGKSRFLAVDKTRTQKVPGLGMRIGMEMPRVDGWPKGLA